MGTNRLEYPELLPSNEEHTEENDTEENQKLATAADQIMLEEAGHSPSGTEFPILKRWAGTGEYEQAVEPLLRQRLGDPLTLAERCYSEDFMTACRRTAISGGRHPDRLPNAGEMEILSVLSRIADCVPLIARFTMEGRWDDLRTVVANIDKDTDILATLQCVGRLSDVDDKANPGLSPEEVKQRNFVLE
ncbi:hypothetical protein DFH06DRAFT_1203995 [Mycena polygramma]|nr:hypothetical protein DFH06DRAFT_1203995 [Mycena polygramma]